jgi:GNAT superfamily N-acetyltransferase
MPRKQLRFGKEFFGGRSLPRGGREAADFLIRRAGPADVPELARLRHTFRIELDPPVEAETEFLARCSAWMTERLTSGATWRCWVASSRGRLVGTLWLGLIEKLPNPAGHLERHAYVSSVYVVPGLRNSGIGSALLTTCLNECRAEGVDSVLLWPTSRSRALYERHGFAVRDDLLERR